MEEEKDDVDQLAKQVEQIHIDKDTEKIEEKEIVKEREKDCWDTFKISSVVDYEHDFLALKQIVRKFRGGEIKKVVVLTGAGISVSAGIPDFRSPGTGLYDNLQKYKLPYPEAIFDIEFFKNDPKPFFTLAKEMWPGNYKPTLAHKLIKALEDSGKLLANFTQNIDGLERIVGVSEDKLIEAHGTFSTATCRSCPLKYDSDYIKKQIFEDEIPKCKCGGIVKPDIVFFGESLPSKFFSRLSDLSDSDLLIIMGTSLQVNPFASLVSRVHKSCPRILVNLTAVGQGSGLSFHSGNSNTRDVFISSSCDSGAKHLAQLFNLSL
jgi:NAD-dependent deacetylase sirtuin 2